MQNKTIKTLRLKWKQNDRIITKPAIARRHVAPLHFGASRVQVPTRGPFLIFDLFWPLMIQFNHINKQKWL